MAGVGAIGAVFVAAAVSLSVQTACAAPAVTARLGGPRSAVGTEASTAIKVRAVINQPLLLIAYLEYNPDTCALISDGTWTVDTAPKKGGTSMAAVNGQLGDGDCPGMTFPFNGLYYTWTKPDANGATDKLSATWSTPDGEFSIPESFDITLVGLLITDPYMDEMYTLDESNYTQTDPVSYTAQAGDTTTAISWTAQLEYATSKGKGKYSSMLSFSTQPGMTQTETYTSMGGQITATAMQDGLTDKVVLTVSGAQIPTGSYTSELGSLYTGGATPTLLEQIATYESSYAQFTSRTLYKISALWPTESYDGGSHIGLMQVAVTKGIGVDFDYTQNAQAGATLFMGNLPIARSRLKKLVKANSGLGDPTGKMVENEALSFYNVGLAPSYYIVTMDSSGKPQWTENTDGDPMGTAYADCVRTQVPPTRSSCS